ncbi:GNAT family N-acetyltransferase [Desulfosediminicola sp.]|uniref:GNAT family N-acetyltransferase n=1 Tax=Desulfosediminicola sp. TaxID=2886825 RepID=UPI003AF274E4
MFSRKINGDTLRMCLAIPQYGDELYRLIDRNRDHLGQWLPWLDETQSPADTKTFISAELMKFARGEALYTLLLVHERIGGTLAFKSIDSQTGTAVIGYWLAEEFTGLGIMSKSVTEIIQLGKEYYDLKTCRISCAVENIKSRAIPERLGFHEKETLANAECVNGRWLDHIVYELNL